MSQVTPIRIGEEFPSEVKEVMESIIRRVLPKRKKLDLCNSTIKFMNELTPYSLKPHQKRGLRKLLNMEKKSPIRGGLLCDEPGMGKTIQIGALMKENPMDSNLIIVPVCVVNQWAEAMRNIFNPKNVVVHTGNSRSKSWEQLRMNRTTDGKDNMSNIIVITTYGIVTASKKTKDNLVYENNWGRVILDEGHFIRNSRTNIFEKVNRLKRNHSWILTGTPLQNKMADIRTLFKFINSKKVPIPLNVMISNNLLRRTKAHLENTNSKLDDYTITNYQCKFQSKEEQEFYLALHRNIMEDLGGEAALAYGDVSMEMLEQILRLRQASIHPELALHSISKKYGFIPTEKDSYKPSAKVTKFIEKVKEVEGYSIAFCHFRAEMSMLKNELNKNGIESELYHGSMSSSERQAVLAQFPKDRVSKKVLIIQIKAGGVGLNLQQFTSVFIISPDWNPSNEIQAIARAHRIGQSKKVEVFKFTTTINDRFLEECEKDINIKTIDQIIINKQRLKRILMAEVLDDDTLEHNEVSLV